MCTAVKAMSVKKFQTSGGGKGASIRAKAPFLIQRQPFKETTEKENGLLLYEL